MTDPIIAPPPMNPNPPVFAPPPEPDSPLVTLARVAERSPKHFYLFLVDLLIGPMVDGVITTWLVACVLLAFVTSPLIALMVYFAGFTLIRVCGQMALAIGQVGASIRQHAVTTSQQGMPTAGVSWRPSE